MTTRFRITLWACGVSVMTFAGCSADPDRPLTDAERQELRAAWGGTTIARPINTTPVAAGQVPLFFSVEQPAEVVVTDDAGAQWGPANVPPQTIVRITASGITAGSTRLASGPMTPGRLYKIFLNAPASEPWQTRVVGDEAPKR